MALVGIEKAIYEFCDQGQTFSSILNHLKGLGEPYLTQADEATVNSTLETLVEARVMLLVDNRYISLAVPMDDIAGDFLDSFVGIFNTQQSEEMTSC